jgi:hypothetical protein
MNVSEWISIAGVLGQLLVGAFFLGITYQIIKTVVRDVARTDQRVNNLEVRVNDHGERIRATETRENEWKWRVAVLSGETNHLDGEFDANPS